MNAANTTPNTTNDRNDNVVTLSSTKRYLQRTTGTGYGRSSGYATDKRYTSDWGQLRFRCA